MFISFGRLLIIKQFSQIKIILIQQVSMKRDQYEKDLKIQNGDDQAFTSQDLTQNLISSYENKKMCLKKAVVFVGNSRMGKTTLLAVLSHIELLIVRKQGDSDLKIQPKQSKYRNNPNFIQHNKCSVTQFPNIKNIDIGTQQISIIDLPGFKDSSYFRQLCNWHHTLKIIGHLQKALFVMVVEVYPDSKVIKSSEMDMMLRFQQAFYEQGRKADDNIIFVVNFVTGIQNASNYNKIKKQIVTNTLNKFQKQYKDKTKYKGLKDFYEKCFSMQRVLLIQKVERKDQTDNQLKQGIQYKNKTLEPFINDHLKRMIKPNSSTYKLKFTLQNNLKSRALRKLLFEFVKQTRGKVQDCFDILKKQISQLIKGYNINKKNQFTLKDYDLLQKFSKQDISQYKKAINKDEFHQTGHNIYESIEDMVCDVGFWFKSISKQSLKESQERQKLYDQKMNHRQVQMKQKSIRGLNRLKLIKIKFQQLLKLCENIFTKHCTYQLRNEVKRINRVINCSFNIQISSLIFVYQSVQDFRINFNDGEEQEIIERSQFKEQQIIEQSQFKQMFLSQMRNQIYQILCEMAKFKYSFNEEIPKVYLSSITEQTNIQPKEISIDYLKKLKDSCFLLDNKDLKQKSVNLLYSSCHRKLTVVMYELHKKTEQSIKLLNKIYETISTLSEAQLKMTIQYKKTDQWINIKSGAFIKLIRYLVKAGHHQQKVCNYYMLLNDYHEELFQLISTINNQYRQATSELKQGTLYGIFMQAGQYFIKNLQFQFAQSSFNYASHVYSISSDERKQAKQKIVSLWKLDRQLIYQDFEQNWKVIITDEKYMEVLKRVKQESTKMKSQLKTDLTFLNNSKTPSHHSIEDSPEARKKMFASNVPIQNQFKMQQPTPNPDDKNQKKVQRKVRGFVSYNN